MLDGCIIDGNRLYDRVWDEYIIDGNEVDDNELDVNEIEAHIAAVLAVGTFEALRENC